MNDCNNIDPEAIAAASMAIKLLQANAPEVTVLCNKLLDEIVSAASEESTDFKRGLMQLGLHAMLTIMFMRVAEHMSEEALDTYEEVLDQLQDLDVMDITVHKLGIDPEVAN